MRNPKITCLHTWTERNNPNSRCATPLCSQMFGGYVCCPSTQHQEKYRINLHSVLCVVPTATGKAHLHVSGLRYGTTLKTSLAAFLKVPREVRMLWSPRHEFVGSIFRDTHEIEAIGPLAMLATGRKPVDPLHRQCGGSGVACLWIFLSHPWRRCCGPCIGNGSIPTHHTMALRMDCQGDVKKTHGVTFNVVFCQVDCGSSNTKNTSAELTQKSTRNCPSNLLPVLFALCSTSILSTN